MADYAVVKAWRKANPEKKAAQDRRWRAKHPDKRAAIVKRHREHGGREKNTEAQRRYRKANPEAQRRRNQAYQERKRADREAKAGRPRPPACELCGEPAETVWDHCHQSGEFRGWLCQRCNRVLGSVKDSPELLRRMALYLEGRLDGHLDSSQTKEAPQVAVCRAGA